MIEKSDPLRPLREKTSVLIPGDPGYTAYTSDVVLHGHPDAVVRPRSEKEVQEILRFAGGAGIPLTAAGGQTSLTGSSVAEEGILLATENLDGLLDIAPHPVTGKMTATAGPGIFLGEFQRALEAEGWFYPPDPTSRNEARLGATVATNATGEDTLLYGPTRKWVRSIRVVRADGEVVELTRRSEPPRVEKGSVGYLTGGEELDLLIGSEGTLGVITRVTVDVIPKPHGFFCGMAFFPTLRSSLEFVTAARRHPGVRPRALELMDRDSLDLVTDNPEGFRWPEDTGSAIVFKQEYASPAERTNLLETWFQIVAEALDPVGGERFLDHILVIDDPPGRDRLRSFRHRIPATLNEVVEKFRKDGGGKMATDWWVPMDPMPEFLERWSGRVREAGLRSVMFGHIGNGHPHLNFIAGTEAERQTARELMEAMCREAVAAGGGVAGEHGLGKLHRNLLAIQHSPERIARMRDIKRQWDPGWILGRGNIFP